MARLVIQNGTVGKRDSSKLTEPWPGTQVLLLVEYLIYMLLAAGASTWAQVPRLRLTTSNLDIQAVGSWARYLGLGTQAEADDEQS